MHHVAQTVGERGDGVDERPALLCPRMAAQTGQGVAVAGRGQCDGSVQRDERRGRLGEQVGGHGAQHSCDLTDAS